MSEFGDEWVYGDSGKSILYTVRLRDGSEPDYTSATSIELRAYCKRPQRSFTLTGSVSDGPNRVFSFASPGGAADDPGAEGARDVYDFRVYYTYGGKNYVTTKGRLAIVRFP